MKRSECTVEKLKALGYVAKANKPSSWRMKSHEWDCNERQAKELFELVVSITRTGGAVEIRQNNYNYTVNVYLKETDHRDSCAPVVYYLSRPMNEAERLEADLFTGRGKDWDYESTEN